MDTEQLKPTPASEFRSAFRKMHRLPSGRVVEIRKLDPARDFADIQDKVKTLAAIKGLTREEVAALVTKDKDVFNLGVQAAELILTRGVVRPKLYCGDISDTPDDGIHISDLGEDSEDLVQAILTFSGVNLS